MCIPIVVSLFRGGTVQYWTRAGRFLQALVGGHRARLGTPWKKRGVRGYKVGEGVGGGGERPFILVEPIRFNTRFY